MRKQWILAAAVSVAVAACPAVAAEEVWEIDPAHASAQFKVRHMMVANVTGGFGKVAGKLSWDPADLTKSSVEASIDTTSIDSANERRDTHLKSPDFFDVEKFPTITFKSKKVEKAGEGKLKVTGDLTIRGVTKEVLLDVEGPFPPIKDPRGNMKSGVSATTTINRQDFGVAWNSALEGGGLVVGNDVTIMIEVELVKRT